MNEKDDVVSNFLNEAPEARDIFKEETENEESEDEAVEEKDEKPLPFNRDPKVQKYIERQVEKAIKDRAPSAEQTFKKDVEEMNLPDSFVKLVGNDTPEKVEVLKDLSKYFSTLKGEARKEFLDELKQQEQAKIEADRRAQEELDSSFEDIEETYNVDISSGTAAAKQMRSQFIEYIRKIAPKDENGDVASFPDLKAAFEEFQDKAKRAPATRAKELASRGMARSGDTSAAVPQGRGWKDVDRFLEKLKTN